MKAVTFELCVEYQLCFFRGGRFSPFEFVEDYKTYFPIAIMGEFGSILNEYCKTFRSPQDYTEQIADECADTFIYLLIYGLLLQNIDKQGALDDISDMWHMKPESIKNEFELCELIKNTTLGVLTLPLLDNQLQARETFNKIFTAITAIHFYMLQREWQITMDSFHRKNIQKLTDANNFTLDYKYRGSCWVDFTKLLGFITKIELAIPPKRILFLQNMITSQKTISDQIMTSYSSSDRT